MFRDAKFGTYRGTALQPWNRVAILAGSNVREVVINLTRRMIWLYKRVVGSRAKKRESDG